MSKFKVICCHVFWRDVFHITSQSDNIYDVTVLEQGLHNTPESLRKKVQKEIDKLEAPRKSSSTFFPEAVILGYGLCSNGLNGIEARSLPLIVPKAHDCITVFLGSKERYKEYFDLHPGTYWFTPGWIETCDYMPGPERHEAKKAEYVELYGEENAEYLLESEIESIKNYTNFTFVDFGWRENQKYKEYTKTSANWAGVKYEEIIGDSALINSLLEGREDDRFVVVPPGGVLIASNDENVLRVKDEKNLTG